MAEYAHGITVVGDWSSINPKTVQTKLQLYFQSKKKSQGGDCEVQCGDRKATVLFKCQLTRDNVLSKKEHNLTIDNQVLKLNVFELSSAAEGHTEQPGKSTGTGSDVAQASQQTAVQSTTNEAASKVSLGDPPKPSAVVLENLPDHFTREYLLLFVENITDVSEENCFLEFIPESNTAVITFNDPNDVEMCIKESKTKNKFQQKGITIRVLEQSRSVKVENLPPQCITEWLELYFEKWGGDVEKITIISEEHAAIVTFKEQEAAKKILSKKHTFYNTLVDVYIYYQSLGTALYGRDRPTWTLPTPFTEKLHPAIREFLLRKGLISSICNQMMLQYCQVNMDKDEVLLSPLPSLLKRKGITKKHIDDWEENTKSAFKNILSNFALFEYSITPSLWPEVEKDIRSTVQDKALLDMNTLTGNLALAGTANDINILKPILEDFLKKASSQLERKMTCISESMNMSPATFFLLQHEGLTHAASKYPQLELDYKKDTNQLIFKGLKFEIIDIKNWILEKQHEMKDKTIKMDPSLLEFLRSMDWEEMSGDLFTSQKIGAVYKFENGDLVLTGSTDKALTEAEKRLEMMLTFQDISLDDPEVVKKPEWQVLTNQMCNIYNSSRNKTVLIKSSNHKNKIIVCGFKDPVLEVSKNLETFINTHSRINEAIRVKSHAVVKFINEKKSQEWQKFVKSAEVKIEFETKKPLIRVYGERVHVQPALKFLQNLAETLHSEKMTVKKAGVKKFFQEQGTMVLMMMMKEHRFLVLLEEDYMEDDDELDYNEGNTVKDFGKTFCEVRTPSGIVITVKMADICKLKVDAVVNAANEELHHIGGLALALLKAAGPSLQQISNQHVALNGKLKPGEAIVTKAGNLPCKCVVHAVGPRYYNMDKSTAVKTLRKAVRESLNQAASNNCTSIAVPTISSGIFGFPLELCTETIAKELRDYTQNRQGGKNTLNEIHLVDNSPKTVNAMTQAVKKEFADLNPKTSFPQQMSSHQGHGRQGQEYQDRSNNQHGARGNSPRSGDTRVYMDTESEGFEPIDTPKRHKPSTSLRTQHKQVLQTQNTQEGLKILLQEGNIQDAVSDVIVNTVSKDLDLSHGAVSSALLQAAGPQIQVEAYSNFKASGSSALTYGAMLVTDGYNLNCQRVFHTVCPYWKGGAESGDEILKRIIQNCLKRAENQKMASISFPAIGTGNLGFPKDLVSNILLREIHAFSSRVQPQNLNEVTVIVHPADKETVQCFIKSFNGGWQRPITTGTSVFQQHSTKQAPAASSAQPTGLFGVVSTPNLGVHRVQIGHLILEVSSGDITRERCDAIVNSSNQSFSLKAGVSQAILNAAGASVEQECAQMVATSRQQQEMITTTAGQLPCRHIIHVIGRNAPDEIKNVVYSVLKLCEEQRFSSVAFPALGTGQGRASPSAVADAMIDAVIDFVKKKKGTNLQSVKFLIFQAPMVADFHRSMLMKQQKGVENSGGVIDWVKGKINTFTSLFGIGGTEPGVMQEEFMMVSEDFEPVVFQLCGESKEDLIEARKLINSIILREHISSNVQDSAINFLSQEEADVLLELQRELTVSIHLSKKGPEPEITLEGLTRDVMKAENRVRDMIRKAEKRVTRRREAILLRPKVEWQYEDISKNFVPFDILTNFDLEEAYKLKICADIVINNKPFKAILDQNVAIGESRQITLRRTEPTDQTLPQNWTDMKGALVLQVPIQQSTQEYTFVEKEFRKTGLTSTILTIDRIQNETLWRNYMNQKAFLERKNNHQKNEKLLFHGTGSKNIEKINDRGFNRSFAGTHGAMIGNGVYFAVDPAYSAQGYASPDNLGHKRMYLARVLVGDYTTGKQGLLAPPAKSSSTSDLYDSVTNNLITPTMFVIFHDVHAYPEYLITFQ
ncbi:protein mono-ADP-ribosyltransferase PARP14-like isoform X2 [Trichomycterus rosablanca]|uniref:protein mono-ADP-ribosyltransferase PARP14-like isoform X2 n=1 Tax=Trichomycterus rosablanca TaxID=2290929 RepID=UPI002F35BCE8